MSQADPVLMIVSPVPPPVHGAAVATKGLICGIDKEWNVRHVDARYSGDLSEFQSFKWFKCIKLSKFVLQVILTRLSGNPTVTILTPTFLGKPFLKDAVFVWLVWGLGFKNRIAWLHTDFKASNYSSLNPIVRGLMRITLRRFDHYVCVAEVLRDSLPTFIDQGKVSVVHNGVKAIESGVGEPKSEDCRVLFLSNFSEEKGWRILLKTAEAVCQQFEGVCFDFYGALGWDCSRADVESAFLAVENSDRILYHGPIDYDKRGPAYQNADIFCFPSMNEAFPLVVLEAMSAGLPIVASDVGGVREALVTERGGFLVEPGSSAELKQKLIELCRAPEMRLEMGEFNRGKYNCEFTMSSYASNWRSFLHNCRWRHLAIMGHYGGKNFGDEAMLGGLVTALKGATNAKITVFTKRVDRNYWVDALGRKSIEHCSLMSIRTVWKTIRSDALILGGGTHFHDDYEGKRYVRHLCYMLRIVGMLSLAKFFRKQVFLVGMGFGPFYRTSAKWVARFAAKLADGVVVRDQASLEELKGLRCKENVTRCFDPAAFMFAAIQRKPQKKGVEVLGISVTSFESSLGSGGTDWLDAVAEGVASALSINKDFRVKIFVVRGGHREDDCEVSAAIRDSLQKFGIQGERIELVDYQENPFEMVKHFQKCSHFIASRYHSAVIGYLSECRLLLLAYHRKVSDLANEIGLPLAAIVPIRERNGLDGFSEKVDRFLKGADDHLAAIPVEQCLMSAEGNIAYFNQIDG